MRHTMFGGDNNKIAFEQKDLLLCQEQWWRCDDLGLFYSPRTWAPCSHGVHELLWKKNNNKRTTKHHILKTK